MPLVLITSTSKMVIKYPGKLRIFWWKNHCDWLKCLLDTHNDLEPMDKEKCYRQFEALWPFNIKFFLLATIKGYELN